jgi:hypothetical protein
MGRPSGPRAPYGPGKTNRDKISFINSVGQLHLGLRFAGHSVLIETTEKGWVITRSLGSMKRITSAGNLHLGKQFASILVEIRLTETGWIVTKLSEGEVGSRVSDTKNGNSTKKISTCGNLYLGKQFSSEKIEIQNAEFGWNLIRLTEEKSATRIGKTSVVKFSSEGGIRLGRQYAKMDVGVKITESCVLVTKLPTSSADVVDSIIPKDFFVVKLSSQGHLNLGRRFSFLKVVVKTTEKGWSVTKLSEEVDISEMRRNLNKTKTSIKEISSNGYIHLGKQFSQLLTELKITETGWSITRLGYVPASYDARRTAKRALPAVNPEVSDLYSLNDAMSAFFASPVL